MTKVVREGRQPAVISGQPVLSGSVEATYVAPPSNSGPAVAVNLRCSGDFYVRAELSIEEAERLREHLDIAIGRYHAERTTDIFYAIPLDTSALGVPKHLVTREERERKGKNLTTLCGTTKNASCWYVVAPKGYPAKPGTCEACYKIFTS